MHIFWNIMILIAVYFIFEYHTEDSLMGSARLINSLIIVWAFGNYFHFEASYFPLIGIVVYLLVITVQKIINQHHDKHLPLKKDK